MTSEYSAMHHRRKQQQETHTTRNRISAESYAITWACATCGHCNCRRSATIPALYGILRIISRIAPTGVSPRTEAGTRDTPILPTNIRRSIPARRITASQIAGLYAPRLHLLTHLHQPGNTILSRRMRGKQARKTFRRKRIRNHHRSNRLRTGSLLHRHRLSTVRNLIQCGRERLRIFRKHGTIFVGIIFSRTRNRHLNKRSGNRRKNRAQQHTQQSKTVRR